VRYPYAGHQGLKLLQETGELKSFVLSAAIGEQPVELDRARRKTTATYHIELAKHVGRRRPRHARAILERGLALHPEHGMLLLNLAVCCYKLGDFKVARKHLRQLKRVAPTLYSKRKARIRKLMPELAVAKKKRAATSSRPESSSSRWMAPALQDTSSLTPDAMNRPDFPGGSNS